MKSLPRVVSGLLCLAVVLTLAGAAVLARVVADGLGRFRTMVMLEHARIAWKHGDAAGAAGALAQGARMAVEGGMRWQVAQVYLAQSDDLKRKHQLREAARVCSQADKILAEYDNGWALDYRCDLISWQLVAAREMRVLYGDRLYNRNHK